MMYRIQATLLAVFLMSQLSCSSSGSNPFSPGTGSNSGGNLKISIKSNGGSQLLKSSSHVTINRAQVVIHEIELETDIKDSMDFEFEQPFVQDLAIDTTVQQITSIDVPPGIYEEMEIDIAALTARDSIVYGQNPDLQDLSIRIEGTVDADSAGAFVFTSDLDVEQETEFDPPLVLSADSSATNIVISVDMRLWFVNRNGDPLDPRDPANQERIEKNIKNSFRVFEDRDDDGEDDSDDGDSDGDSDGDGDGDDDGDGGGDDDDL